MEASILIPVVIILAVGFVFYKIFGGIYKQNENRKRLAKEGDLAVAYVKSIAQTGVTVNQMPEMRLLLQIENIGGQPRQVEIKQLIDLGSIPRVGDKVYVLIDQKDPDNVVLSSTPFGGNMQTKLVDDAGNTAGTVDLGSDIMQGYMALSPELRERGKPGVATIVSVMPAGGRNSQITMDIDNIGEALKRVTITQPVDGNPPAIGTRLYFLYDPQNPEIRALAPSALTGGQSLAAGANRVDPLVLGPQLLQVGAKAMGTVLSASSVPLANPILADRGYSKWNLLLNVTPQNVTAPYQANLTISLSSAEKAAKIAHVGAEVPLRYDPLDLQTISIDSIAMGYPDPYEEVIKIFTDQLAQNHDGRT
ncbi:hypothetical protein [Mucilaginibacter paludis]|uniref:S1 motif domain-containing protein n=1 Tax=Mucilaginibacter paludis DSM 18603 TaxID=714943 RepID=H1Y9C3_9SPHI|nr:hypothetical protein [Mucilaginibacter paludis]EHQ29501.1 hypothetical protein Mucpa_5429 [Mucilaginibacter paludis DSM 18603]